jgi:hypothetical protein
MRIVYISFLIVLVRLPAFAGDCRSHPMFIHEMEIHSCELISEGNAGRVSRGASPKVVAARYPGAILEGTQKAVRQIDFEEPFRRDVISKVHPWQKKDEKKTYLYKAKGSGDCSNFKSGSVVKFASFTSCECDTGPAPDGYCALTVEQVYAIPEEYRKYAD